MTSENNYLEIDPAKSAAFFTERARRIASKVTALSRKEELTEQELTDLQETIKLSTVYGQIALGYGLLAMLDELEKQRKKDG